MMREQNRVHSLTTMNVRILRSALVLSLSVSVLLLSNCAGISSLPQSVEEVPVGADEGRVGWSRHREETVFANVTLARGYEAAKVGLAEAKFTMKRGNLAKGVVIAEHGITFKDWNVMAGVYLRQEGANLRTIVITQGSRDVGFDGDSTSKNWTGDILRGMRRHLKD